jgi:diguanylate cyclase (GGDEF)-like protein
MAPSPFVSKSNKPLDQLLGQNEHVEGLVAASAEDLAAVNLTLQVELGERLPGPGIEDALLKSKAVEEKVLEASETLTGVNQALKDEIKERELLEDELAQVKAQGEEDHHAALHDPLTGLPNRALFRDRLDHGLAQAMRHGWALAVMFVDLDDFKTINDSHGHDAGDTVLRTIADRLLENTRNDDTVSRHGGDEFLYLLMEIQDEQDITIIAEKLLLAIQAPCPLEAGGRSLNPCIKASIGIALFPRHGTTSDELISRADGAMYRAKQHKLGFFFAD